MNILIFSYYLAVIYYLLYYYFLYQIRHHLLINNNMGYKDFTISPTPHSDGEDTSDLVKLLNDHINDHGLHFSDIQQPHLSLSKPFTVRYHWIDSMTQSLRERLSTSPRWVAWLRLSHFIILLQIYYIIYNFQNLC